MKKTIFSIAFFFLFMSFSKAEKRRILFLGNSYTYVNDLPNTLKQLALSLGDTLETDNYTPGGSSLQSLFSDANTLTKIQLGNWDYIVVQAQSQEPSFPPSQVQANTYPFAHKLDSVIHVFNPCAETVFYMTWGRKNGDASNCASYPTICTYDGMQMRLRQSYVEMCQLNSASCSPVGVAWRTFRTAYPLVELYNADESHPSENGTYLAACTFYSSLYQKSSVGATYLLSGVADSNAIRMQTIATATVLDSIENWQQYGSLPYVGFIINSAQNQITFTNTSLRSTKYNWSFGDGSPVDTMLNPVHTFANVGTYNVTLIAKNSCNKYSTIKKTITISTVPNGINELADNTIFFANNRLFLKDKFTKIKVQNTNGQLVIDKKISSTTNEMDGSFLPKGVYFYQAINEKNKETRGRFLIQ